MLCMNSGTWKYSKGKIRYTKSFFKKIVKIKMWLDFQRIHEIATVSRYNLAQWVNISYITQYIYFIFKVDVLNYKYNDLYDYKTERSENRKWYSKLQQYSGKHHFMQMERGWHEPWDEFLLLFKCWQTLMEESKSTKNGRVHVLELEIPNMW